MSVFVWGSNKHQQLVGQSGLHSYAPAQVPTHLLEDQIPIQIAAGDEHVLVLCESGDVYSFGGGNDGQLGQGQRGALRGSNNRVQGLEHETVVHIAAGAHTSFAVTSTGSVYHWGLVHVGESVVDAAATGQLPGMAADQDVVIQPEADSRRERAAAAARSGARSHIRQAGNDTRTRYLRDIVRESTERWMLPTEDAEAEFYEELGAMGYHIDEVEEMVQQRDEEHFNMLRMVCRRQVHVLPTKVLSLERRRIVSVSAGYAHVMALSDDGRLYGAGYNDRGQLGLGHRINTSEFKIVDVLKHKFVVEISCGQQHNICRAIDRAACDESIFVGTKAGADAYSWGNGILGQLGLGRRGTTKGRMIPTLILSLHEKYPSGVVAVAAGANFTAVATITGEVLSFGHAEYNQHGTGTLSNDYVDPYHFFEPRKVDLKSASRSGEDVMIVGLNCGSVFTLATDSAGNLHSWGWNESGVLGHGFSHFSSAPQRIDRLGARATGCKIAQVSCGAKHVIALVKHQGAPWAAHYRHILEDSSYADCILVVDSYLKGPLGAPAARLHCHRAVLATRCSYLQGFIRAAERADPGAKTIELSFGGPQYNSVTMRCLVEYLYLDRTSIPSHKRKEMAEIAKEFMLPGLHRQCYASTLDSTTSSFLADMTAMMQDQSRCDVVFVCKQRTLSGREEAEIPWRLFGHKFVLSRIPYFEAMFSGTFADCQNYVTVESKEMLEINVSGLVEDGIELQTLSMLIKFTYWGCTVSPHNAHGEESISTNEVMAVLVAANRLGFSSLGQVCERLISMALRHASEEDLVNCMAFAHEFNLPRLERQCVDLLRVLSYGHSLSSEKQRDSRQTTA